MQPLLAAGAAASNSSQQATTPTAAAQATSTTEGSSDSAASQPSSTTVSQASRSSKGDACIIFISSVAGGPLAGRSGSLYAVSKAGLNQLAASLACEWASAGIRVNSVAPWVTLTELGKQVSGWGVIMHQQPLMQLHIRLAGHVSKWQVTGLLSV